MLSSDGAGEAEAKLRRALERLVDDGGSDWIARETRPLLGLPAAGEGAEDRSDEAFRAWGALVERMASRQPLVLVLEDLHWADERLLDWLEHLAEWVCDAPLVVIGTARPELLQRRPRWGGGRRRASRSACARSDRRRPRRWPDACSRPGA